MPTTVVRVIAESAGGGSDDVTWKFILDTVLESGSMKKQMCFGFASNDDDGPNKRWPFIIRPEAGSWVLDYGADSEDAPQRTNFPDREIRPGNYFTIWDGSEEVTMRITQVTEL